LKAIHSGNITPRQHTLKEYKFALNELAKEITPTLRQDIAVQLTAAVLYTLATWHGWGKVRLRRFFDEVNSTFEDMGGGSDPLKRFRREFYFKVIDLDFASETVKRRT
jgi:hypothetical protein